ncbi:hypothetical protein Tco_1378131 [Tanacetum coccineum]
MDECVSMSTPMATERLDADLQGTPTDQTTYRRMIRGLMYLTASRPDIAFATFVCARYQARPTVKHLKEVKRIFRYLRQSYNMGLWYPKDSRFELIAYSDADHAGCKDDCKSTSGGLQFLGEKLVSWSSKKQDCTAMSTAEAEYVSLSACCAQVIWMRTQLLDYGYKYNKIPMYCDSKSAIAISCNPVQHSRTKHINIRYHFIKEHVEKGTVELYFVGTEYQLADLFTKALPKERFEYLVHRIVIIMAQQQHAADVHPDELCPPNKRYDLMDANKKVDLEQFWHTLKEDGSNYRLTFMLDKKVLNLTLDDFRTIFHLPQENANNHDSFVPPPLFLDMVQFYKQKLGFTMELKTLSSFKTTGLLQPWQMLCKIFSKCLTTHVTRWDQPPLQIMQMMYFFVNNIHVDYAKLLWEGLYYSLHHPTSSIPYPRFTKIIISHNMTCFPEISRHARDMYHNLQDDNIMKNIFNTGRHKDKVGMQIPDWMITEEMKHTEHYRMSPNPKLDATELSAPKRSTVIRFCLPERRSTRLTPPPPVLTFNPYEPGTRLEPRSDKESLEVDIIKDKEVEPTNDEERREKGKIVEDSRSTPFPTPIRSPRIHTDLVYSDTKKLQELTEVMVESLPTIVDKHITEQVKKQVPKQVKVQVPVYVAKGLLLERQQNKEETNKMIAKAMLQERGKLQAEISLQIHQAIDISTPSLVDASVRSYMSGHILHVHPAQPQTSSIPEQQYQLYLSMKANPQLQQLDIAIWLALQIKFETFQVPQTTCRTSVIRPRYHDDPHDDAHTEGENSAKRQKTYE